MTRPIPARSNLLLAFLAFFSCVFFDSVSATTVNPTTFQCSSQYVAPMTANYYYVSTTHGSDSNPGTVAQPWQTISHAASVVTPDTTVVVMGGVYYEQVNLHVSGTASGPIIFISQTGSANTTADGYSETTLSIIDGTNNKASCAGLVNQVNFNKVSYVHFIGFVVRNNMVNSDNCVPTGVTVTAPSSNIYIANNYIHYIRAHTQAAGNAHGIEVLGNSLTPIQHVYIWHNEVAWLRNGFSESVTINGNVQFVDIADNLIHNNQNIGVVVAGGYQQCPDASKDRATYVTVSRNIVYSCSFGGADGLYCDGCAFTTFDNNIVYGNDNGIELASENAGWNATSCIVSNSISFSNNGPGGLTGGYAPGKGKAFNNQWLNNVFYHNSGTEFDYQFYITNNTMHGNTYVPSSQSCSPFEMNNPASFASDNTADYDVFYYPGSNFAWSSSYYSTLTALQSGARQELHAQYYNSNPADLCSVPGVKCVNNVPQFLNGCPANGQPQTRSPNTQAPTSGTVTTTRAPHTPSTAAPTHTAPTTATPTTPALQSLGCFLDKKASRSMTIALGYSQKMTPALCVQLGSKQGLQYVGIEYASECWGSNTAPTVTSTHCNMKCSGDLTQFCGGSWALSVFSVGQTAALELGAVAATSVLSMPSASGMDGDNGDAMSSSSSSNMLPIIIGASVGGVVILIVVAAVVYFRRKKAAAATTANVNIMNNVSI